MGDEGVEEWITAIEAYPYFQLLTYLLGIFCTILGLELSLYGTFQTYQLWKKYLENNNNNNNNNNDNMNSNNNNNDSNSTMVTGDVISSNANTNYFSSSSSFYEVTILYEATSHRYATNPRQKFRQPHSFETKRYIRTFQLPLPTTMNSVNVDTEEDYIPRLLNRGDTVNILLLPGMPRSGCLRSVIERAMTGTNCGWRVLSMALVGLPGLCLLGLFIALCIEEIMSAAAAAENPQQEQINGIIIVSSTIILSYLLARMISMSRYQKVKRKLFECAVPIKDQGPQQQHQQQQQQQQQQNRVVPTRRTISSPSLTLSLSSQSQSPSTYSTDENSGIELGSPQQRKKEPLLLS